MPRKPIYGVAPAKVFDLISAQTAILEEMAETYNDMIDKIVSVVDLLVQLRHELLFIGNMSGRSTISNPAIAARLVWIAKNPKVRFNSENPIHISRLKQAYLSLGIPYDNDPLLVRLSGNPKS
jgi:hypothetical protein